MLWNAHISGYIMETLRVMRTSNGVTGMFKANLRNINDF